MQTQLSTRSILRGTALAVAASLLAACATPVGVRRVDAKRVHRELTANALSTDGPSEASSQLLNRLGLADRFEVDPGATLAALHAGLAPTGDADLVFALAELSFLHGEKTGHRDQTLAAAIYAYAFLFPDGADSPPDPLDPRLQVARNIYNRGITLALASPDRHEVILERGTRPLPFGRLDIAMNSDALDWSGYHLEDFVPAAELEVRGFRNRYRHAGLGAPLAASIGGPTGGAALPGANHVPPRLKVPVTAFLRIDGARANLHAPVLSAKLEVYAEDARATLEVDGQQVPLEQETTAPLAYMLEGAPIWDFEFAGFRSGDLLPVQADKGQLFLLHPHRRGRIPVVFVHGTASSPARWAEMVNELGNDPAIASRYEFWLFVYNTGNPIAYSAGILVKSLREVVAELDSAGTDPALWEMVVVGHSQGGLLTKLTAVDSGTRFWDHVSDKPIAEMKVSEESRTLLQQSLFYQPLPFVRCLIFIATPHRGSYLAAFSLSRLVTRQIKAPLAFTKLSLDLVTQNQDERLMHSLAQMPTSLDNMTPGNPFLRNLSEMSIDPRITAHSIVAVQGDGPPEEGGDGVVKYSSAHIDGVASEKIVRSSHSTQANPDTINEVKRILIENATQP